MAERLEQSIDVPEAGEALPLLAASTGLSKTRIKDAMTKGAVWLTREGRKRRLRRATSTVAPGDTLDINYDADILGLDVPAPELIADEKRYSVWYKPAGIMSSGSRFGDHCAIDRIVERDTQRKTFLVHRLDQYASGLIVLAHDKSAAASLARQFQERTVNKVYRAIVDGTLEKPVTISEPLDGRDAVSHITPIASSGDRTLVEVSIETGRKHQIRRHLAHVGHAVLGDRQYGQQTQTSLVLTACEISLDAPDSGERRTYLLPEAKQPAL